MMQDSIHQGRSFERSESGSTRTENRQGTLAELTEYLDTLSIGAGVGGMQVRRAKLSQVGGPVWRCEVEWSNSNDGSFGGAAAPSDAYGVKSAQLSCGMLSIPVEKCENYRTQWNYFLAGCDTVAAEKQAVDGKDVVRYVAVETASIPEWWETRNNTVLSLEEALKYRWVKSPSELPVGVTKDGRVWHILKDPTKPGTDNYDVSTYQITMSTGFRSAMQAGKFVCNRLNRIGRPEEIFSIAEGDWKVDAANISWDGKKWKATLTYTRSGNASGWDPDLYKSIGEDHAATTITVDQWREQVRHIS